jgi:hypothetical protein
VEGRHLHRDGHADAGIAAGKLGELAARAGEILVPDAVAETARGKVPGRFNALDAAPPGASAAFRYAHS